MFGRVFFSPCTQFPHAKKVTDPTEWRNAAATKKQVEQRDVMKGEQGGFIWGVPCCVHTHARTPTHMWVGGASQHVFIQSLRRGNACVLNFHLSAPIGRRVSVLGCDHVQAPSPTIVCSLAEIFGFPLHLKRVLLRSAWSYTAATVLLCSPAPTQVQLYGRPISSTHTSTK